MIKMEHPETVIASAAGRANARPMTGATIAVGTLISERPPHRTVRAAFPHTAPTSGVDGELAVCAPAPVTRLAGTEPGPCCAGPHFPRPPPLAPPAPQRIAPHCSPAS